MCLYISFVVNPNLNQCELLRKICGLSRRLHIQYHRVKSTVINLSIFSNFSNHEFSYSINKTFIFLELKETVSTCQNYKAFQYSRYAVFM